MIDLERMTNHVESLIKIDSESRHERDVALRLKSELDELGAETRIDDAGSKIGSNVGNVIAFFRGTKPNVPPFLLSAHMDTVVPGKGIRPMRSGKSVKSSGDTILGGDDKTGCSAIIEVLRSLKEKGTAHGDLEIVFSVCEEIGLLGAKAVDPKALRAKDGIVLDSEFAAILTTRGPAAVRMEIDVHGRESHAGVAPELGISAIKIASAAIAKMKLGRVDKETTANIGVIQGGMATNIIPNHVHLRGEARSLDVAKLRKQVKHMKQCLDDAASKQFLKLNGKRVEGKIKAHVDDDYAPLRVNQRARIIGLSRQAAKNLKYELKEGATGGGSDANVYNRWGIRVANLGTGMRDIHTVKEWIDLDDFNRSANLLMEMVALHAAI